jgi:hypothetical protein
VGGPAAAGPAAQAAARALGPGLPGAELCVARVVAPARLTRPAPQRRTRQKPKMEVLLVKSDVFEEVMADEAQRYGTFDNGAARRRAAPAPPRPPAPGRAALRQLLPAVFCFKLFFKHSRPPRAEAPYDDLQEDAGTREGAGEVIEEANLPDGPEASAALAVPGMGQGRACVKSDEDGPS